MILPLCLLTHQGLINININYMNPQIQIKNNSCQASGQITDQNLETEANIHDIIYQIEKSKEDILNSYDQIESHLLGLPQNLLSKKSESRNHHSKTRSNISEARSTKRNKVSSFQDHFDFKIDEEKYYQNQRKFSSSLKGKQNLLQDKRTPGSAIRNKSIKNQIWNQNQSDRKQGSTQKNLRGDMIHEEYLKKLAVLKQERRHLQQINDKNEKNIVQGISLLQRENINKLLIQNNSTFDNFSMINTNSPDKSVYRKQQYNQNKDYSSYQEQNLINQNKSLHQPQRSFRNSVRNKKKITQSLTYRQRQRQSQRQKQSHRQIQRQFQRQREQFQSNRSKKDYNQIKNQIWKNWDNQCSMFSKINIDINNSPQFKPKIISRYRKNEKQKDLNFNSKTKKTDQNEFNYHKVNSKSDFENIQYLQDQLQQVKTNSNKITKQQINKNQLQITYLNRLIQKQKQNALSNSKINTKRNHSMLKQEVPKKNFTQRQYSLKRSQISFSEGQPSSNRKKVPKSKKVAITSEPMKKIRNRIKLSDLIYEDSIKRNSQHEKSHLQMTYEKQKRGRSQICSKICQQPTVLKKYKKNFKNNH